MNTVRSQRRRRRPTAGVGAGLALAALVATLGTAGSPSAATAAALAAPGNTSAPTIVGDVQQGSGVAASTGAWSNSPTGFSYQWMRCDPSCSAIGGATSETYVVTSSDAGNTLKVTVTATNGDGSTPQDSAGSTVDSLPSGAPANEAPPTISGTAKHGQTLTAASGSWSGGAITYQWQRCDTTGADCSSISGATGSTYTAAAGDVGSTLRVAVTAKNGGAASTAESAKTAVVAAGDAPNNTSKPTISGNLLQGETLTANHGNWSGDAPISYSYQWRRCNSSGSSCSNVGSNSSTYALVSGDVNHTMEVVVTATNAVGDSAATSDHTALVTGLAKPKSQSYPFIAGNLTQNSTLTVNPGSWSGTLPIAFSYQWQRCDANGNHCGSIRHATGGTYKLTSTDIGHRLRVRVTGKNSVGSTNAYSKATSGVVGAGAPVNTSPPVISGALRQGSTVKASRGSWSSVRPVLVYRFQWFRCDSKGGHCTGIAGASQSSYALVGADVGHTLLVQVRAQTSADSTIANSKPSGVVGASALVNTSPPVISGTLRQGSTVRARAGGWSSSLKILVYRFQWFRCDSNGEHCAGIVGASHPSYRLRGADVGHTLLVQVRAQTSADSTIANSKPSGVVAARATSAIGVGRLRLPDRLQVDKVKFSPKKVTSRKQPLVLRVHVREISNRRPVSGALVRAIAIPYNRLSAVRETPTDGNGWATLTFKVRKTFPLRKGYLITVFLRARKPGGNVLAGISTRRLVALRVG